MLESSTRTDDLADGDDAHWSDHIGGTPTDLAGRVRQIAMNFIHIGPNVDELIRCAASISNEQN